MNAERKDEKEEEEDTDKRWPNGREERRIGAGKKERGEVSTQTRKEMREQLRRRSEKKRDRMV